MKNKSSRILYIGPISAVGGISVHIKRLSNLISEIHSVSFIDESPTTSNHIKVYNIRSMDVIGYLKTISKAQTIHIHSTIWWLRLFHVIISRLFLKKTIMTVHSLSTVNSTISLAILRVTIALSDKVILVSEENYNKVNRSKALIKHAFLPPARIEMNLPDELTKIIELFSQDNKLIVGNAYKLNLHNGQDLYGLDLLIKVAEYIKHDNKNLAILFVITTLSENKNLFDTYIRIIDEKELGSIIKIITYPISFAALISKSDIVVRPTNTDGDALTVREALYLNKKVIASDIVKRPSGTILFKNRDPMDLYEKILQNIDRKQKAFKSEQSTKYIEFYKKLYFD